MTRASPAFLIHDQNADSVRKCKCNSDDQRNTKFFKHDPKQVGKLNLSQCNSADDQGGTLRTTVSAGIHQHGDEGYKKWNRSESVLVSGNDGSCDGSRKT